MDHDHRQHIKGQGPGLVNVLWAEAKRRPRIFLGRTGHGSGHTPKKQGSLNDKECDEGRPDPKKLAGLFKQVQSFALYNAQSRELHTVRDELVYNSQLCDAVKVYLATKACEQPRTLSMPQCVCWHY
jgi:hypothetical protein